MIDFERLFSTDGFMPHGMCYMWRPSILAVHVGSDSFIALAYFTIPFTLVYFVRKRAELRFSWIFLSFAIFIIACGISHVMEIWTIWYPMYWLSGGIKVITALASIMTAILLVKLVPSALRFPTPTALQTANDELAREILERTVAQQVVIELNASLEARVAERTQQLVVANLALRESERFLARAGAVAGVGGWEIDLAYKRMIWSDETKRLLGVASDYVPTVESASAFYVPASRSLIESAMQNCIDHGRPFDLEVEVVSQTGRQFWVRATGAAEFSNGEPVRLAGALQDVTERRQDAQRLRELSSLLTTVLDSASEVAVIASDPNLNLTIFNMGAERLLGFNSEEIVGHATAAVFHDADEILARGEELSRQLGYPVEGGAVFTEPSTLRQPRNWTYIRKDGTRLAVSLVVTAMHNVDGSILGYLGIAHDITRQTQHELALREALTEAKLAEMSMRESEERFRTLANAIPQMAHIWRADGFRTWYNQRWYDYTGSTPEPMEGWGWQSVHDPELLPSVQVKWRDAIAAGEPFEVEFPLRGADGLYREFVTLAVPQKDAGGKVIRWIATDTDITERKRASEQFRLALEAAPTGMLMMNETGIIVLVNAQIEALFGYPREELLGQRIEMLVPERFRAHHPDLRKLFFGDPKTRVMGAGRELYGLRKDGTEVPIEIGLNPLQTSEGRFVLSSIADISARKRANEVQQRMTALVDSTSDAILTEDLEGIIRSWNPAATHLFGYAAEEMIGQPVTRLMLSDCQTEESGILDRIKRGQRIAPFDAVRLRKDRSTVEVSLTISPIYGTAEQVVGASKIMRDVTPMRMAAEALRAVNAELVTQVRARTSQLKERESLLQEIHHRVKNNLQVISSLINMQIRGLEDESSRAALRDCQSRVVTMAKIHEMLYQSADYAQVPFARYTRDLATRVLSASGTLTGLVTLQFELDDVSLPVALAIPCGLILNELVANSLKHAFPNAAQGVIRVELRLLPDRSVFLSVSDDGIGLSSELDLNNLTALGVQLVMNLVGQLDGQLEIIRRPGSSFRITFPLESAV